MDGDLLARGAFADIGAAITSVSSVKQFLVAGDLYKGISLLASVSKPPAAAVVAAAAVAVAAAAALAAVHVS